VSDILFSDSVTILAALIVGKFVLFLNPCRLNSHICYQLGKCIEVEVPDCSGHQICCQANFTVLVTVPFQTLSHEPQVLKQGLLQLNEVLMSLEPLHKPLDPPGGSVLLHELVSANNITEATLSVNTTPLLHSLTAAHAYIMMFVHVCRAGQVSHWFIHIDDTFTWFLWCAVCASGAY
jgi:hypothetical protein